MNPRAPAKSFSKATARSLHVLGLLAAGGLVLLVGLVVGGPLSTPDLWFHLKAGETYFHEGLWPVVDPMLFTGLSGGPIQHEWLFGVFAYLVQQAVGFSGLRLVHVAMVFGIVALVANLARRSVCGGAGVALLVSGFVVLAWPRLVQFRPDLWTIAGVCLIHLLVLRPRAGPSHAMLAAACVLQLVWLNAHSLSAIGIVLTAAALLGAVFERGILNQAGDLQVSSRLRATVRVRRMGIALGLLLVVGLIHPRGIDQLLTIFISSSDTAIWEIRDEWTAFNPFSLDNAGRLSVLTLIVADSILIGFACLVFARLRNLRRRVSEATLRRFDPPAFFVAAAACGAMLIAVRFLWMGVFPLLYLLSALPALQARVPRAGVVLPLVVVLALALLISGPGGLRFHSSDIPRDPATYLSMDIHRVRFAHESAQFLLDTGARGRLYNPYQLGAYYGYHLAPKLRTFIDSRTEHYSADVYAEWKTIAAHGIHEDGRTFLQLLDDRRVDFFFGVGPPGYGYSLPNTLGNLHRQPGWLQVYRNAGQVVFLRDLPRNRENLDRIVAYYAAADVPFDRAAGLNVGAVLEHNPVWAITQAMVPPEYVSLRSAAESSARSARIRALVRLANIRFVAGDYKGAVLDAQQAIAEGARVPKLVQIAVYALLRQGGPPAARRFLEALSRDHGKEPWARDVLQRLGR
ncbi:MAG: hypothetical protein OES26_03810 [Gammaproteobacteria bacterium]|nr:hypothetical protein [Gammaproteobacteria bacterium]